MHGHQEPSRNDVVLSAIASADPAPGHGTEEMITAAGPRFSDDLIAMIRSLGIDSRRSIITNYLDLVCGLDSPKWSAYAAELAADAARACLADARADVSAVGLVIGVSSSPPRPLPGFVCDLVAHLPELPHEAMNVNMQGQGCAPLLKAVDVARWFLRANSEQSVLVVCAEAPTAMSPPLTAPRYGSFRECASPSEAQATGDVLQGFLFGDAMVAMLLTADGPGARFGPTCHLTNQRPDDVDLGQATGGGSNPPLTTPSRQVLTLSPDIGSRGTAYAQQTVTRLLKQRESPMTPGDFPEALVHTGSRRILDGVRQALGLRTSQLDASYRVLSERGNVAGASLGLMIVDALADPTPREVLMTTFGIGFSASAGVLTVPA